MLVLHTFVLRVQYSCDVVLVFWFWWEIVFDVTYILSVQCSCVVVSVFWLWREIVFGYSVSKKVFFSVSLIDRQTASKCVYF